MGSRFGVIQENARASATTHENECMSDDLGRDVVIFTEALRLPVEERAEFLERACAGDENLRKEVEALLDAHERVGNFLENPPLETGFQTGTNGEPGGNHDKPGSDPDETNDE